MQRSWTLSWITISHLLTALARLADLETWPAIWLDNGAEICAFLRSIFTAPVILGYHAALVLDLCFAAIAFVAIEALHTQISSLFLGKDGTAFAYQVSGDYMKWIGCFFIFMGIKMATDGVLRGLGIMRPFLVANMVNLAIRLSVALICAPRFGIAFVWLAVPAGWLANFLISYVALRRSWPTDKIASTR